MYNYRIHAHNSQGALTEVHRVCAALMPHDFPFKLIGNLEALGRLIHGALYLVPLGSHAREYGTYLFEKIILNLNIIF